MSEPEHTPSEKDARLPAPGAAPPHGNTGEGAASVLRALLRQQADSSRRPSDTDGPQQAPEEGPSR